LYLLGTQVPSRVGRASDAFGESGCAQHNEALTCQVRVYITNAGEHDLHNTVVNVQAAFPICTSDAAVLIGTVRTGVRTPQAILLDFTCDKSVMPTSTEV
jgi:hypothetical protein